MAVMGDHTHSTSKPGWRLTAAKYVWLASFLLIAARIAQEELHVAFLPSSSTAAYLALIAMGLFQALLSVEDRCRLPQFILMAAGSFILALAMLLIRNKWPFLLIGGLAFLLAALLPSLLSLWTYLTKAVREMSEL